MSPMVPQELAREFWTDTCYGRRIAIFKQHGAWHVYLDDALQHDVVFATAGSAVIWLINQVDQINPVDQRIAPLTYTPPPIAKHGRPNRQ